MTALLQLKPTKVCWADPEAGWSARRCQSWDLSSLPHIQSLNLTDHLRWLVDQLDTVKSTIQQLSFDLDLNLGGISVTGHFPPHHRMLWAADLLRRITEFNLWMDFDHYFQS